MRFEEGERRPFEDLAREFRAVLEDSVRDAVGTGKVGAFLSGGTDSSTIAGLIGKVRGEPADTYSIGFDARGYDEMEYARIAARHFGTRHHEYYVTPEDIVAAVPKLAAIHDQPFGNSSAVPTYCCARFAGEDGVTQMIGGDGGDELFGGNARYAKQHLYALYDTVPRAARKLAIEPAVHVLGMGPRLPVLGKVVGYVNHARIPMPARLETYNLLQRLGIRTVLRDDFVDSIDVDEPLRLLDAAYSNPTAGSLINHMLALDLKFTLADNDLPKVTQSCELAGLPVAFPMLDERVVDFSARLPPDFKLKCTRLRYFFKEALRGFLPDETIRKKKQGFGLPFGVWVVSHAGLRQLAFDSLGDLRKRDLVKPAFLDRLRDEYLAQHPGYYGTMVWILMMLEQWFKQHIDTAADARRRLAA
jgi:asparagine synthase (glutamine-hydrolysing)